MKYTPILIVAIAVGSLFVPDERVEQAARLTGGNPERGRVAIKHHGCGSCHIIPGVPGAHGLVGPSLERSASRVYIAGVLENSPKNLMRWIDDPPAVDPLTAMPDLELTETEIRDIAAYLTMLQ